MIDEIKTFKGFDAQLKCRGFQYVVGATYEHTGKVSACNSGFHACENPADVWSYYPPGISRYAETVQSGTIARHPDDSKIASAKITVTCEITLHSMIERVVKWIVDHATVSGAASNSGYRGAASNSGGGGAASNSGDSGAASNSGDSGAASNSGVSGAAMNSGFNGRVMGCEGTGMFLVYRKTWDGPILHVWAGIAGQNGVKIDTWYVLGADGQIVEWQA